MGLLLGPLVYLLAQVDAASAPPAAATTAPPVVVTTPWPAELPCRRPRTFWFQEDLGAVVWSSADGRETHALVHSTLRERKRVPSGFTTGRLTRLSIPGGAAKLPELVGGVDCAAGAEIMWGPCAEGVCRVSASYPTRRVPKKKQPTTRWTAEIPDSPFADAAPDAHWTRFHRDVGHKKDGDPEAARASIRFSRAFAVELRDLLANACRPRRCTAPVDDAQKALAAYLHGPSPTPADAARREVDNWNYVWSWTATAGGVALRLSCDDLYESRDLLCDLALDLPGALSLVYDAYERRVSLYAASDTAHERPLGRISGYVEGYSGPPVVTIDGRLMALDEAGLPPS